MGFHYSAGDYGTSATTEIVYVPLTLEGTIGAWSGELTLPYLRISGGGGIVQGPNGPVPTTAGTADGLGDVLARGSYTVFPELAWIPFVELAGLVKFPTASRSRGLGTGRFDFGIESDLTWMVGRVTPFAAIGYRFLGDTPGARLRNVVEALAGSQVRVLDPLQLGLLFDYRQAASASSGDLAELVPFGSMRVTSHWSVNVYVSAGLANGSPEVGTGLEIAYLL